MYYIYLLKLANNSIYTGSTPLYKKESKSMKMENAYQQKILDLSSQFSTVHFLLDYGHEDLKNI